MNVLAIIIAMLLPSLPAFGLGYLVRVGQGEKKAYTLGYHEGGFDAVHMPDVFAEKEAAGGH